MVKTLLLHFFFPLPLSIELILCGLILLWFTRKTRAGKILVTLGVFVLIVSSTLTLPAIALGPLERRYAPIIDYADVDTRNAPVKYVVVLGGTVEPNRDISITSRITSAPLVRAIEGMRLFRMNPGGTVILTGGGHEKPFSEAEMMAGLLKSLGMHEEDMILETEAADTYESTVRVKNIVRGERFLLVTSAAHMPRAVALFKAQGMNPLPAPTDHGLKRKDRSFVEYLAPSSQALRMTEAALYEYLGLVKEKSLGRI